MKIIQKLRLFCSRHARWLAAEDLLYEGESASEKLNLLGQNLEGKRIALVGNADSLLTRPHPEIDEYDVVIRINRGVYVANESDRIGKRTDILLVSGFEQDIDTFLSSVREVVWMTPLKRNSLTADQVKLLYFYPKPWWQEVADEIGARPSTGCMGIDLVSRYLLEGELHLYGFDFWRSPTSYSGINRPGPHSPDGEEAYARRRVPGENIHGSLEPR